MHLSKSLVITIAVLGAFILFVAIEALIIRYNGSPVPRPHISAEPVHLGSGPSLTYVVLGDSTAVSQGGEYARGYAQTTAEYLAVHISVTFVNVAVPGARTADVANAQVPQIVGYKPDVVLVAVGANDVTHLTSTSTVQHNLQRILQELQAANCNVRIVLTGAPDMGAPPRLPQPARSITGARTTMINKIFAAQATNPRIQFAPIAAQTGAAFRKDASLFAADRFHPSTAGYDLWTPVIERALDQALGAASGSC